MQVTKKAIGSLKYKEWEGKYINVSMFSHMGKMFLLRLLSMILGTRVENVNIGPIHNKEHKVK